MYWRATSCHLSLFQKKVVFYVKLNHTSPNSNMWVNFQKWSMNQWWSLMQTFTHKLSFQNRVKKSLFLSWEWDNTWKGGRYSAPTNAPNDPMARLEANHTNSKARNETNRMEQYVNPQQKCHLNPSRKETPWSKSRKSNL